MLLRLFIAFIAGVALTFAFSPFNIYPLAFFSVAALAYLWLYESPKHAFFSGLSYGIGFFGSSTYWVFISIHFFGNVPISISIIATGLLVLFLAFLFFALLGPLCSYLMKRTRESFALLAIFPSCWVLGEFWRTYILTGFPWELLGYSQMNTPLRNLAPIVGVYGLSFITALIGSIFLVSANQKTRPKEKYFSLSLLFIIFVAGFSLKAVQWTKPSSPPITVSLIQGNIDQNHKWDVQYLISILETYKKLTKGQWNKDLIIWPEAAVPVFPEEIQPYIRFLNEKAKASHSNLLFGIPLQNTLTKQYYNGMMIVGESQGTYKKEHLVPFGEYLPLKFLFGWFYSYFQVPMSSADPGPRHQSPLQINGIKIAPFICYEIIYPWRVLRDTIGRQLIISISDDSWFGNSIALQQHQQMAQMRALETGRYLLLGANTGITAVIDPKGEVIKIAPKDQEFVLEGTISPMSGKTPLMLWQYYPILLLVFLCIFRAIFRKRASS